MQTRLELEKNFERSMRSAYRQRYWNSEEPMLPEIIWHYTTAQKLINIISTNEFWFTHVSCLNDRMEAKLALDTARMLIERKAKELETEGSYTDAFKALFAIIDDTMLSDNVDSAWFVASFTALDDDNGQWSLYGGGRQGDENGIAIGFDPKSLVDFFVPGDNYGIGLWRVEYNTQQFEHFCGDVLDCVLDFYSQYTLIRLQSDNNLDWLPIARDFVEKIGPYVDELSVIPKPAGFKNEVEWRLTAHDSDITDDKIEFLARKTTLSRHARMSGNREVKTLLPIKRVIVGPGKNQDVNRKSVISLLRKHGYDAIETDRDRSKGTVAVTKSTSSLQTGP